MRGLTRQEKEKLVLELYSQGKTYREIAKEARVSLRDIGPILKKSGIEQSLSPSSHAYKLFGEGKSPNEVAITLNAREPEITELYREYWKLNQLYELNQIYEETKGDFSYLLEFYRQMKAAHLTVAHAIRVLRIANKDLPSVEYRCQELRREEASLRAANNNAAKTFQDLSDNISEERETLNQYRAFCHQQRQEKYKIQYTKLRLEELIEYFQNNNEEYLEIKEAIKREVLCTLKDPMQLLRIALISLIVSSRKDPNNFHSLYYNMNIPTNTLLAKVNEQNISFKNDDEPDYEKILLSESEMLYNKIVDEAINKTINGAVNRRNTIPQHGETELFHEHMRPPKDFPAYIYQREKEQTFIQSELESEEDGP